LVTFIHEVAHLLVKRNVKHKYDPHGAEWKQYFRDTFRPLLSEDFLPKSILIQLSDYLKDPAASTGGHHGLYLALRAFDVATGEVPLKQLAANEQFSFQGRIFVRGELRRTRYLCTDVSSKKQYLVPAVAMVRRVA
jgi:SprT protein